MTASPPIDRPTRAGTIAILGRPNAGKSTLMNALVGGHLSICSAKAQTTWRAVAGIRTEDGVQMVFLDTPGLLTPRDLHQRALLEAVSESVIGADLVMVLIDAADPVRGPTDPVLMELLGQGSGARLVVVNKVDVAARDEVERAVEASRAALEENPLRLSAVTGEGIPELVRTITSMLPERPFMYPDDEIATAPVRFFVSEFVREAVYELYRDELPYATHCSIEEFREGPDPWYINAVLYVEKASQKGILLGKDGRAIRELGISARGKIEHFLGHRVYLDLWVKVLPNWRRRRESLARLGYHVPAGD